jgi:hypothetical protein
MQSVHRHFGKYMKRTADDRTVSVLLKDFEDADQLLSRVCGNAEGCPGEESTIATNSQADFQPYRS